MLAIASYFGFSIDSPTLEWWEGHLVKVNDLHILMLESNSAYVKTAQTSVCLLLA
jgi:hypothetical protein